MPIFGRPLDRYVLGAFMRIFSVTALGFPLLVIVIDLTDSLDTYLDRKIPVAKLAMSYLYFVPESLFMILPASVLFATVFTINSLTRHSEITAAKASGVSFYRIIAPLCIGALLATGVGLVVGELVPLANARRNAILGEREARGTDQRYNFAHTSEDGRVYTVGTLDATAGRMTQLEILRRGTGPEYPSVITIANEGDWRRGWHLREGVVHVLPTDTSVLSVHFVALTDRRMTERPAEFLKNPKAPDEMQREELTRYIRGMQRSGVDVNPLRVELMLRIAIPVTCLIIFMFGAPLATSSQRGGAAFGVGISLATTVVFLMLVQLTKAIGKEGMLPPEVAAWVPSLAFALAGVVLLAKVRT
jgi:lipopolysaccharide export system permease protein